MSPLPPRRRQVTVAHAHTGRQAYVFFRMRGHHVFGNVQFPAADLNQILGLSLPLTRDEGTAALPNQVDPIRSYISDHFSVTANGTKAEIALGDSRFIEPTAGAYVVTKYNVVDDLVRPMKVALAFDGLIEAIPDRTALVIVLNGRGFGRFTTESETRYELAEGRTTVQFEMDRPGLGEDLMGASRKLRRAVSNRLGR